MSPGRPPSFSNDVQNRLLSRPIAHRGLWSPSGPPENSLGAFAYAVDDGYGIELDVRLSQDGWAMVFHDAHLARMASSAALLSEKSAVQLAGLRLRGTAEPIPTLEAVLSIINGQTPVLVELKSEPGAEGPLEGRVARALASYSGPIAVIGFNPGSHGWFAHHHPEFIRGLNLNITSPAALEQPALENSLAQAQPDFLLPGLEGLNEHAFRILSTTGLPLVPWTVRSPEQWTSLGAQCATLIFEGWRP